MHPAHASMLFESEREMDVEIWESIPKTTNAEEVMHWKLYSGVAEIMDLWRECPHFIKSQNTINAF